MIFGGLFECMYADNVGNKGRKLLVLMRICMNVDMVLWGYAKVVMF